MKKAMFIFLMLAGAVSVFPEIVIHTRDGRAVRVNVEPGEVASIEFISVSPSSQNLSGNDWNYGPTTSVSITQQGSSITINAIVKDHGTPGPHYQIKGTITGNKITGTWRWIGTTTTLTGDKRFTESRCLSGSITAEIASDSRSFRIVDAEDPCGHGWNGIIFRR